jgi:hypothetical protein
MLLRRNFGAESLILSISQKHFFLEIKARLNQIRQEPFNFQELYAILALEARHNPSMLDPNRNVGELEGGIINL